MENQANFMQVHGDALSSCPKCGQFYPSLSGAAHICATWTPPPTMYPNPLLPSSTYSSSGLHDHNFEPIGDAYPKGEEHEVRYQRLYCRGCADVREIVVLDTREDNNGKRKD